jgi:tRNA pseudouridine55 synthase
MDGVLIIDKPPGLTSHDVVARVRKITGARRVGHTGTLDPFATGVLVILVGRTTRLAQFLSGAEKEYEAVMRLGYRTDTGDLTGTPLQAGTDTNVSSVTDEQIESAIAILRGQTEQTPPMYSAKKIGGRKLYELARRGGQVARLPVPITIRALEAISQAGRCLTLNDDQTADLRVRVVCSAGTYVRALAEDLGKQLGIGGHLAALRRTRAGNFAIADAIPLDRLATMAESDSITQFLISPDEALSHLPAVDLDAEDARRILNGISISVAHPGPQGDAVRLRDARGKLLAVGIYHQARGEIQPKVVIGSQE